MPLVESAMIASDPVDSFILPAAAMQQNTTQVFKKFSIVLADPPWEYNDKNCNGAAGQQYKTLKQPDLCGLGEHVKAMTQRDALLFLWATMPLIPEALELIDAWGFEYKTVAFVWLKRNKVNLSTWFFGLGRWTRGNAEIVMLAKRGKPSRVANNVFQLIEAPVARHSAKPPVTKDRIVQLAGDLPRIELFARESTPGWVPVGNEIDGRDIREALPAIASQVTA